MYIILIFFLLFLFINIFNKYNNYNKIIKKFKNFNYLYIENMNQALFVIYLQYINEKLKKYKIEKGMFDFWHSPLDNQIKKIIKNRIFLIKKNELHPLEVNKKDNIKIIKNYFNLIKIIYKIDLNFFNDAYEKSLFLFKNKENIEEYQDIVNLSTLVKLEIKPIDWDDVYVEKKYYMPNI